MSTNIRKIISKEAIKEECTPVHSPFELMYQSFSMFANAGQKWERDFIPLSAGVNWVQGSGVVRNMLHRELESSSTYRNYGNAGGIRPVTDVLEKIECKSSVTKGLKVQLTNGATEGAWLILECLKRDGRIKSGDNSLSLGHCFPLYNSLSKEFELNFNESLGHEYATKSFLPDVDTIQQAVEKLKPKVIFLLMPNNPFGESFSGTELSRICEIVSTSNSFLLIDRVCQMPWDDRASTMRILAPLIVAGNAVVVDSLSKSESLAGLRIGFIITNQLIKQILISITQTRYLNPIVFSSVTLALCRLAEYGANMGNVAVRALRANIDEIFSEYPKSENYEILTDCFEDFLAQYIPELKIRQKRLLNNFEQLHLEFGELVIRPLIFKTGFNCTLSINEMRRSSETEDVLNLCNSHGVGVLTEQCFRSSGNYSHYFIRVGLSLEEEDFKNALFRLKEYYL